MSPTESAPGAARVQSVLVVVLGAALGFSLSRIGFTSYAELQQMFLLRSLRLFLVFGGGVAVTGLGLLALGRWKSLGKRPLEKRVVVGGVVFGAGWALAGACPAVAFAQVGEGKPWALLTVAGMLLGTAIARRVVAK